MRISVLIRALHTVDTRDVIINSAKIFQLCPFQLPKNLEVNNRSRGIFSILKSKRTPRRLVVTEEKLETYRRKSLA